MQKGVDYIGVGVSFICHDGKGNYLMNKRGKNCRDEHGKWDFGGGGVDFGFSLEETVYKEVKEEYGVKPISCEILGYKDVFRKQNGKHTHWISNDFLVQVDRKKVKNNEPHKFNEIGWFKINKLPKPLHPGVLITLKKFKDKLK